MTMDKNVQMTLQLSSEQYERLFLQPNPTNTDGVKRFGNPTLLGLLGFLIPFQSTMFCLLGWNGASPASLPAISGCLYFMGGIALNVAGLCEFLLGNTFPFTVFIIYGCHLLNVAYSGDPAHPVSAAFGIDGATSQLYNSGQAFYNLTFALVSAIFMLGSLRTNVPFVVIFFTLTFVFGLMAAASWTVATASGSAGLESATYLLKVAGGVGFVTAMMGWYLAIIVGCAATGVPCPLPIGDLSTRLFVSSKKKAVDEEAGLEAGDGDSSS